jgi:hypothetical protein
MRGFKRRSALAKELRNEPTASGRCVKLRNEPKNHNSRRLEERFDIWPIFVRTGATGGLRSSDVMGNIGEIPRQRGVNGCAATPR